MLSGSLIAKDEWEPFMAKRKGLPVLQSHGTDDPILSPVVAQQLRDMLLADGVSVEWHEFRGGHEIPMDILQRMGGFIREVLYKDEDSSPASWWFQRRSWRELRKEKKVGYIMKGGLDRREQEKRYD